MKKPKTQMKKSALQKVELKKCIEIGEAKVNKSDKKPKSMLDLINKYRVGKVMIKIKPSKK